jgi:uncharacterized membrane protein YeiH
MTLTTFDLIGVAVFAISGALAAGRKELDLLGVVVLATVTAIGGGTLRDVLLDRHPLFWIENGTYFIVIIVSALGTVLYVRLWSPPMNALLIADALGLALFALSGAQVAEGANCPLLVVVFLGTATGVAGGVLRDVMVAQIPLILRQEIYATAAIMGIVLYKILHSCGLAAGPSFYIGIATTALLRLLAIQRKWRLPSFRVL